MGLLRPVGMSSICRAFLLKSPSVERDAPRPEKATAVSYVMLLCPGVFQYGLDGPQILLYHGLCPSQHRLLIVCLYPLQD